jgi:hypothetical protein
VAFLYPEAASDNTIPLFGNVAQEDYDASTIQSLIAAVGLQTPNRLGDPRPAVVKVGRRASPRVFSFASLVPDFKRTVRNAA